MRGCRWSALSLSPIFTHTHTPNPVCTRAGLQFNASSLEYADKNCSTIRMYTGRFGCCCVVVLYLTMRLMCGQGCNSLLPSPHPRPVAGVKHRELLRETISWDDMASMNCCNFGSCGPVNRACTARWWCVVCVCFDLTPLCETLCMCVLLELCSGGGARGASWQHAPANDIRGTMGHQFRSGLRAGDSIPLFVPSM